MSNEFEFDLNKYDLSIPGGIVLPSVVSCRECGTSTSPSNTEITYGNKKLIVQNLCDSCVSKKVAEGKTKAVELRKALDKMESEGRVKAREDFNNQNDPNKKVEKTVSYIDE